MNQAASPPLHSDSDDRSLRAQLYWQDLSGGDLVLARSDSDNAIHTCQVGGSFVSSTTPVQQHHDLLIFAPGSFESGQELGGNYRKAPASFPQNIQGEGLVLVIDQASETVVAATDRLGRTPVYYSARHDGITLSTSLSWLREKEGACSVDSQGLYDYIYFHMVPAPLTINRNIRKLQAGQVVRGGKSGVKLSRYWLPEFTQSVKRGHAPGLTLKSVLCSAVTRATGDSAKTGAFLSGGLDSTTVAGMLSEISGDSPDAYAIGFDAKGYDEMPYARLSAKHFGLRLHEYYVTPDDVVAELPTIAASFDEPFGNSSVLPAYYCARMAAKDGIDTLLAGDGGDELFAGNERYAKQKDFAHYHRLPAWIRNFILEPVVTHSPDISLVNKARSYIAQANTPLPDRMQHYSFLHQIAPESVFTPQLIAEVNQEHPLEVLREIYSSPPDADELNRMLFLDWQITLADNDLRKVGKACDMAGVKVRYPMLDDQLLAFSMTIPSEEKLPGKVLRNYYKESLRGWLPEATINKSKQGFGLPFGVWMREHKPLQELAYDNILNLQSRNIFRKDFLNDAISRHRDGHASYYGELIWVLAVLELWFSANLHGYRHD